MTKPLTIRIAIFFASALTLLGSFTAVRNGCESAVQPMVAKDSVVTHRDTATRTQVQVYRDTVVKVRYRDRTRFVEIPAKVEVTSDSTFQARPTRLTLDTLDQGDTVSIVADFPKNTISYFNQHRPDSTWLLREQLRILHEKTVREKEEHFRERNAAAINTEPWYEDPTLVVVGAGIGALITFFAVGP